MWMQVFVADNWFRIKTIELSTKHNIWPGWRMTNQQKSEKSYYEYSSAWPINRCRKGINYVHGNFMANAQTGHCEIHRIRLLGEKKLMSNRPNSTGVRFIRISLTLFRRLAYKVTVGRFETFMGVSLGELQERCAYCRPCSEISIWIS